MRDPRIAEAIRRAKRYGVFEPGVWDVHVTFVGDDAYVTAWNRKLHRPVACMERKNA